MLSLACMVWAVYVIATYKPKKIEPVRDNPSVATSNNGLSRTD